MNESAEKKRTVTVRSELDVPQWSVVSFDNREGSGLTYQSAVDLLKKKEAEGVYGLCIITDQAAERMHA